MFVSLTRPFVVLGVFATLLGTAVADVYEVDPVHSSVMFRIKHSNINSVFGSLISARRQLQLLHLVERPLRSNRYLR